MDVQNLGHEKTGKNQAVADLLHENTSRSKGRRTHIRAAVVVNNDSDDDINNRGGSLADQNRAGVKSWVLHLRCNGEISWNASVTENQGCHSGHSLRKSRIPHDLPVRGPRTLGRSIGRTILDTSGNCKSEDYEVISFCKSLAFVLCNNLLDTRTQIVPTHASQLIRPSVRTLAKARPIAAATATNTAVHVPCVDTALRPIDTPSIAEPETNNQYRQKAVARISRPIRPNMIPPASSIP